MHLSSAVDTGADAQVRLRARTPAPGSAAGVERVASHLVRRPRATAAALLDGRLRSGVLKKVRVSTSVVMSVTLLAVLHERVRAHRCGAAAPQRSGTLRGLSDPCFDGLHRMIWRGGGAGTRCCGCRCSPLELRSSACSAPSRAPQPGRVRLGCPPIPQRALFVCLLCCADSAYGLVGPFSPHLAP